MFINKSKYINYFNGCPASLKYPSYKLQEIIDEHMNQDDKNDDIEPDEEMDILYEIFEDIKILDNEVVASGDDGSFINTILEQGNALEHFFREHVVNTFKPNKHDNLKDIKNMEVAAQKTKELIEQGYDVIFEATFIFEHNGKKAVARMDAFLPKEKIFIEFKGTTSSKCKYYLDMNYQYWVAKHCGIEIDKVMMGLLEYSQYKKNTSNIVLTDKCNIAKTAPSIPKKAKEELSDSDQRKLKAEYKIGGQVTIPIIEILKDPEHLYNKFITKSKKKGFEEATALTEFDELADSKKEARSLLVESLSEDIRKVIDDIENQQGEYQTRLFKGCNTTVQKCPYFKLCQKVCAEKYEHLNYSGNVFRFDKYSDVLDDDSKLKSRINELISTIRSKNPEESKSIFDDELFIRDIDELKERFITPIQNNSVVWFDFESLNPPIAVVDGQYPFTQIIFQNSIIRTDNNMNITAIENHIKDPKKISIEWFKQIIDDLYDGKSIYVVYNQGFEKTWLIEMAKMIGKQDYKDKVNYITSNMIDLCIPFTVNGGPSFKSSLVLLPGLKGMYSIKKIEKYIKKHHPDIFDKTGMKEYTSLTVQNGKMAMEAAIMRFYGQIDDDTWNEKETYLKEYCENDVRAMIMVYELLVVLSNLK